MDFGLNKIRILKRNKGTYVKGHTLSQKKAYAIIL